MSDQTLTVRDNRTGATYELPIVDGAVRAMDLRQIKAGPEDFGLMTYDPAFVNTASCRSRVTWLAHWEEMVQDREQKIARPRQVYVGAARRDFVHMDDRATAPVLVGA